MKEYVCKCGSKRIFTRDNGTQTGIYCKECGKWIKWVSKKEIPFVEEYIEEQNKNDNSNTNKIDEVREFIMDNLDKYSNVIPFDYVGYWVESINDLVDATNKKFATNIKCEYVCGFINLGCNVDYYALAGIVEDELFFYTMEERIVKI